MTSLLDNIQNISDIKKLSDKELIQLSEEIREFLIKSVSKTGGHLASNLGVVELTISLMKVFDLESDKIVWDVGHQAYVYKILTGRKDKFDTLRQFQGLSGFPKLKESTYDVFETGHSSTSISAAVGMARGRDLQEKNHNVIAVIGDGALTGGMALEALNDVGYNKTKMTIILNDNQMSISRNVGGLSRYLSKIRINPRYNKFKHGFDKTMKSIPSVGRYILSIVNRMKNGIKGMVVSKGMLFEDMGIKYFGPIDGHNIEELTEIMEKVKKIDGPTLVHVVTKKGKGYEFAEKNPNKFHGVGPFNLNNGECPAKTSDTYSKVFGETIIRLGEENSKIVAITAAMPDGTGLKAFANLFPKRFFDVGIAEQHAVTLAAGLASTGLKPIFAVYSTFLQRGYDQVLHDVCIQKLPVVFCIDRAGIVGEDGETHQGIFDLSYLSHIPNMTIMAPKCLEELKFMMRWAVEQNFPIAIRYPRGGDKKNVNLSPIKSLKLGNWEIIDSGDVYIVATGKMVQVAMEVKEILKENGINLGVINAIFIKPIDKNLIDMLVESKKNIITLEDNVLYGGLGSMVLQYVNSISDRDIKVLNLGFEDEFIPHGKVDILYKINKLDAESVAEKIIKFMK